MDAQWLAGLASAGEDPQTASRLNRWIPLMYEELRAFAGKLLSEKAAQITLQPTSLVHEAYLRLRDQRQVDWQDRLHFFRIAARVMRRVLVDHFRTRVALKRGGLQSELRTAMEGLTIGPYRILHELGRGGMGAVYLAVRDEGEMARKVALKLIKRGMDNPGRHFYKSPAHYILEFEIRCFRQQLFPC